MKTINRLLASDWYKLALADARAASTRHKQDTWMAHAREQVYCSTGPGQTLAALEHATSSGDDPFEDDFAGRLALSSAQCLPCREPLIEITLELAIAMYLCTPEADLFYFEWLSGARGWEWAHTPLKLAHAYVREGVREHNTRYAPGTINARWSELLFDPAIDWIARVTAKLEGAKEMESTRRQSIGAIAQKMIDKPRGRRWLADNESTYATGALLSGLELTPKLDDPVAALAVCVEMWREGYWDGLSESTRAEPAYRYYIGEMAWYFARCLFWACSLVQDELGKMGLALGLYCATNKVKLGGFFIFYAQRETLHDTATFTELLCVLCEGKHNARAFSIYKHSRGKFTPAQHVQICLHLWASGSKRTRVALLREHVDRATNTELLDVFLDYLGDSATKARFEGIFPLLQERDFDADEQARIADCAATMRGAKAKQLRALAPLHTPAKK